MRSTSGRYIRRDYGMLVVYWNAHNDYFFEKNDIILPCPGLLPLFFEFCVLEAEDTTFLSGSSSENDSQISSSLVTALLF